MCPEALRPQTRKAAEASTHQLRTRLSKGEKHHRKRRATVASFSSIAPYVHRANELVGALALAPVRKARQERQERQEVIAEMFD